MEVPKEIEELAERVSGSYWNYRWFKIEYESPEYKDFKPTGKTEICHYYELHEVYYDNEEKPFMWSDNVINLQLEDAEELMDLFMKAMDASTKKVLLLKDSTITEIDEYMDKSEILEKYRKGN